MHVGRKIEVITQITGSLQTSCLDQHCPAFLAESGEALLKVRAV